MPSVPGLEARLARLGSARAGRDHVAADFSWEAGKGEFDEESVVQIAFKRDAAGAVIPGSERLVAFHQCPERGCSYACGVTGVEFKRAS